MPTPLDRALQSRNALLGFAGFVTAAAAWTMWGSESMFPKEQDPTGPPEEWGVEQLRVWLRNRNLTTTGKETREELVERVKANMRTPRG